MGGKGGGGGGDYYQMPPDTSGYGTPEEAAKTLAKEKPIDMSQYQQTINTQRAAADATAPDPIPQITHNMPANTITAGDNLANAVLKPPEYWQGQGLQPRSASYSKSLETTQT